MLADKKHTTEAEKLTEELESKPSRPLELEKPVEAPITEKTEIQPVVATEAEQPTTRPVPAAPAKAPAAPLKDPVLAQVESILEEDLKDIYFNLSPMDQKKFHDEGEEVASKIQKMITDLKVKAKKILNLIRGWLKIIPGVNRFFLEQEAKIKTDKLMTLAEYEKEQRK